MDDENGLSLHRTFDSFGNIVDETHYNASGNTVTEGQTGYLDAAFAYTGRLYDQYTGLQNNLNRWYDASIGRWLSEDPIGFAGGDANLYRYVGNGPVNGTDPRGLDREWVMTAPWWPHTFLRLEINGHCYQLHYSIIGSTIIPCPPGGGMGEGSVLQHIESTPAQDLELFNQWLNPYPNIYIPFIHDCNTVSCLYKDSGIPTPPAPPSPPYYVLPPWAGL